MHFSLNKKLGVIGLAAALLLALVAIPVWVSSPSNVNNIVLAPTFWPYALSGFLALVGVLLLLSSGGDAPASDDSPPGATLRLIGIAGIMGVTMVALPILGMVWTAMGTFLASAFLIRTRHPIVAVICAVVIPLALYAFFAHVAGVAIPQGEFVRLP